MGGASGPWSRASGVLRDPLGSNQYVTGRQARMAFRGPNIHAVGQWITPLLEHQAVFARTLGDDTDIVSKEMFSFTTKGGDAVCLRPEGTAPIMRAAIASGRIQSGGSVRAAYAGPMFRYERPQRGRYRQFSQCGLEWIGEASPESDADMILIAVDLLDECGIGAPPATTMTTTTLGTPSSPVAPTRTILLNSLGDAASREAYRAELGKYLESHRGALSADSQARIARGSLLRVLDSKDSGDRQVLTHAPRLLDSLAPAAARRFRRVEQLLERAGLDSGSGQQLRVDDSLVRGLDYYSHTVFEIIVSNSPSTPESQPPAPAGTNANAHAHAHAKADANAGNPSDSELPLTILAGGRYDGLATLMGASQPVPAFGWAAGIERLAEAAGAAPMPECSPPRKSIIVVPCGTADSSADGEAEPSSDPTVAESLVLATRLRRALRLERVDAEVVAAPAARKLRKVLAAAARSGATLVVMIGDAELTGGFVSVRHLASGSQRQVPREDAVRNIVSGLDAAE